MHGHFQTTAASALDIEPSSSAYHRSPAITTSATVGNSTSSVGTVPYVRDVSAYLELAAFVLIDVIGIVGNAFVLGVVVFCVEMRTEANFFIFSLSVADILVCVLVAPLHTATKYRREWFLGDGACEFLAVVNHLCFFASLFSLATIAVNKAVITRRPGQYHKIFSRRLCFLYISITWFFSLLYSVFPLMGWGELRYDEKRYNCIFSRQSAPSYTLFFGSCCVLLPQLICSACYVLILLTFIQSRQALQRIGGVVVTDSTDTEAKLTKNLFVVWLAFFLCWLPMSTLLFTDPKGEMGGRVYTIAFWLVLVNSGVNPIIYGVQNKHFRKGYMTMLKKVSWPGLRPITRVHPSTARITTLSGRSSARTSQNLTIKASSSNGRTPSGSIFLEVPVQSGPRDKHRLPGKISVQAERDDNQIV